MLICFIHIFPYYFYPPPPHSFLTTKDKFHGFLDSNGQLPKEKEEKKENVPRDGDELKGTTGASEEAEARRNGKRDWVWELLVSVLLCRELLVVVLLCLCL